MSAKDSNTEKLIRDTAMRVFFREGRFQATTQEIADAAGVNRTLVHYYFRSRDQLFQKVLEEGRVEFYKKIDEIVKPEQSFRDKIKHLIDIWMEQGMKYPFLDTYLVSQLNKPEMVAALTANDNSNRQKINAFYADIRAEMEAGNIASMEPIHFLLNLAAMVSYPIIMRPLLERALEMNTISFNLIIQGRKEAILKTVFLK
ncbi:TetR/AcrR family transcriptional regulator [Niabella terrae]